MHSAITVLAIVLCVFIAGLILNKYTLENFFDYSKFEIKEGEHRINKFYPKRDFGNLYSQKIPLKIHQTYFTTTLNTNMYQACMTIRHMNPEYDYYFYDDTDCKDYIATHFPKEYLKAYNSVIPGAYKADLFRYLVLYREGGVYMDCKSSTIKPLRDFIDTTSTFAVFRDRPIGAILNSFMACTPEHPILRIVIDMTIHNILNKQYGENSLDITGPQVLGRAFNKYINRLELTDITPGVYHSDLQVIGSFYVLGTGEKAFEALVDKSLQPLVSKNTSNYYNNPRRICYQTMWDKRDVFNRTFYY
jgi:mannosyltransferase OCH1-like enzyme